MNPQTRALAHRYADHIVNTGGNQLDDLLDGATNALANLPLAVLEAAVQSQAHLLVNLDRAGLLADRMAAELLDELTGDLCAFDLCDGPDAEYVPMKTCRVCATIQRLRATARLDNER